MNPKQWRCFNKYQKFTAQVLNLQLTPAKSKHCETSGREQFDGKLKNGNTCCACITNIPFTGPAFTMV